MKPQSARQRKLPGMYYKHLLRGKKDVRTVEEKQEEEWPIEEIIARDAELAEVENTLRMMQMMRGRQERGQREEEEEQRLEEKAKELRRALGVRWRLQEERRRREGEEVMEIWKEKEEEEEEDAENVLEEVASQLVHAWEAVHTALAWPWH